MYGYGKPKFAFKEKMESMDMRKTKFASKEKNGK
jgi:hypothetical protein